ncbi:MAG: uridine kinase [Caldilineaceae bacterium]|jgi:uridine kinase|nr:uridine kinase [Caldilineaceae bacterium]
MQEIQGGAEPRAFVIGVAGGTGSGKTTVSRRIWETVGRERIAYLQHDNYYKDQSHLTSEERARTNYDHPDSLETSLMVRHLRELRAGRPVDIPVYDFTVGNRSKETLRVNPAKVILVEGILIFAEPDLCELMDMRIFVDTDADIRFIRRLRRDIVERSRSLESVVKQYLGTVRPMHLEFVEPSKRYADIIVPQGGDNRVAMEMIVSRIQALLSDA